MEGIAHVAQEVPVPTILRVEHHVDDEEDEPAFPSSPAGVPGCIVALGRQGERGEML